MGVRGLEKFLHEVVPNGEFSVNILEEIRRKKGENPDEPVVLVFTVLDILYNLGLALNKVDLLFGPPHRKIHEILDFSFKQLQAEGATLVFFANGPMYERDFLDWTSRQYNKYIAGLKVLDSIDSNVPLEAIIDKMEVCHGVLTPTFDVHEICRKYGTLHISMNKKYILDIVKYANEQNAFAIIGNGSNFLIFNGEWRFWSGRDIGLIKQNWDTLEYNKSALTKYIGLRQSQMPMLATISGNDFIQFENVKRFHIKTHGIKVNYLKEHFLELAKYVQDFPDKLSYHQMRYISCDMFEGTNYLNFKMVKSSLDFYQIEEGKTEEVDELFQALLNPIIYHSLKETPIRIILPSFCDLRRTDFLNYFDIELPILKRQIGFVRKGKNDVNYKQHVVVKLSHSEAFRRNFYISPQYPIDLLPNLMNILFDENNDILQRERFKILKWMVFDTDFHAEFNIQNIPNGYMTTVVAVMYLLKMKQLSALEVDAILLCTDHIKVNIHYSKGRSLPTKITSRVILASHLYICIHNIMAKCFHLVGLNAYVDYLVFDGAYFIHCLNKLESLNENEYEDTASSIKNLKYFLRFVN